MKFGQFKTINIEV
ncbi:unnamed protein product [Acanthoscelides obtectus]|uniref:Uncharacterized protein n=1 Tax=Acanthoscelides obtectus TaxID=200917 RepID=A0A9P0LCB2_ACAOB|nr:unnamed protein product [Acanthoscelides obtectus]CAK1637546.1 hypothetical protein AOBTE_LOCUS10037 [Acanthoscelides obtectus]